MTGLPERSAVSGPVPAPPVVRRVRVEIEGIVQGVGFRPFVFRLATRYGIAGWVCNTPAGVLLEAEGTATVIDPFLTSLAAEAPPLARITALRSTDIPPERSAGFSIRESSGGASAIQVAPDGHVCDDCLRELFDPTDRRYRYPFITCTNCGPRYSIITGIPYDRPRTTMAPFPLCPACRAEYEEPTDRRFHAQPLACPACGPRLRLLDVDGAELAGDPVLRAIELLSAGEIVAVKGTGGYHLAVDPANDGAVAELRGRKRRDEKPFALLAADLAAAAELVELDDSARRLLASPERPIVLLPKKPGNRISPGVAPANGYFGVMLPSTPLQHLLLRDTLPALVMTSGNISDEPIAYRDDEAFERLAAIADAFLVHDREIRTRLDDSVIRVFAGEPLFLRRSRGYAPRGMRLPAPQRSVLAVGAELKGALCLTRGDQAFPSQHLGDLQNAATLRSLEECAEHLQRLLEITPEVVAHDLHPDYLSTTFAEGIAALPKIGVQHHHAHLAACLAENRVEGEAIGVIFDGTGYGPDGTVWGGEFLLGDYRSFVRRGHFAPVPLPGGDAAVREPWRMALSYLHNAYGEELFDLPLPSREPLAEGERGLFRQMLARRLNSPLSSSCGRLFDAAAALLGVRQQISYEGQAAIELEALAEQGRATEPYPFALTGEESSIIDFSPLVRAMVEEILAGVERADIARRFHLTVATAVAAVCGEIRSRDRVGQVALSGGVFQNRLLAEEAARLLAGQDFTVFVHRLVPPNDGGIALGQAVIAGRSVLCA